MTEEKKEQEETKPVEDKRSSMSPEEEKAADKAAKEAQKKEPEQKAEEQQTRGPLPPMSFNQLVDTFFLQSMISLGKHINPMTGKYERDLNISKYQIDILELLDEKTKGNLTKEEEQHLGDILHTLRMAYLDETGREK